MRPDDVLRVVECLESAGVPFWVEGGWGVDALLGVQTREHEDVDLAIADDAVERAEAGLAQLGFAIEEDTRPRGLVLRGPLGKVDIHPAVFDERGNGWHQLSPRGWGIYSAEGLEGHGVIAGRPVPCLTQELQLYHHLGYEWDDLDVQDLRLLAERFDLPLPPLE
jgi:lincosamide nucleotidyltransferase A/C/D/E